jgi:short-subunit dehydrogenase
MGEYALVTGGCSGIGLAIARELAGRGYHLLLVSDREDALGSVSRMIRDEFGVEVIYLEADLARQDACDKVAAFCRDRGIEPDVLVNNAGIFFFSEIAEASLLKVNAKILLHVLTASLLCTVFSRQMKRRGRGYILNVSSMSASRAFPGIGHYGATKAYLRYFSKSLRTELKPFGVKVACLYPGASDTNLYDTSGINVRLGQRLGIFLTPASIARKGINGLFSGKFLIIPGVMTRLQIFLAAITPQLIIDRAWIYWLKRNRR